MSGLKIKLCFIVVLLCAASLAFAGNVKKFVLNDGSVIQAEILSYSKGVYQLRSSAIGKFALSEEKIQSIQFPDASGGHPGGESSKGSSLSIDPKQMDQMKNKIMADPQTNKLVEELQKDPTMQQILGDKDLLQAIERGDVGRLVADPKIQSLMNNKEIGKILEKTK